MLKNAPNLGVGGVDTAENGPSRFWEMGYGHPTHSPSGSTGARSSAQVKIWIRWDPRHRGKTLAHCHFLAHEDTGMAMNVLIE